MLTEFIKGFYCGMFWLFLETWYIGLLVLAGVSGFYFYGFFVSLKG